MKSHPLAWTLSLPPGRAGGGECPSLREGLGRVVFRQRGMGRGFSPLHVYPPTSPPRPIGGACGGIVAMGVAAHAAHVAVGASGAPREGCGRLHSASGGSKDMPAGVSLAWPLKASPLTSCPSAFSVARSASRGVDVGVAGCAVRPRGCAASPCGAGVARGGLEAARTCRSGHTVDGRSAATRKEDGPAGPRPSPSPTSPTACQTAHQHQQAATTPDNPQDRHNHIGSRPASSAWCRQAMRSKSVEPSKGDE